MPPRKRHGVTGPPGIPDSERRVSRLCVGGIVADFAVVISGALVGLSVAAPVGPMGILCINRTLAEGMTIGVVTGLGASTVQTCYGAVVFLGLSEAGALIERNSQFMSICGAMLMFLFSVKLLRAELAARPSTSAGTVPILIAYGSAVVFNLSNPLTVVLLVGAVTAIFGAQAPTGHEIGLLLLGIFAGSASWWLCLSGTTSLLRGRLTPATLKAINRIAAAVLFGFGLLAVAHAVRT